MTILIKFLEISFTMTLGFTFLSSSADSNRMPKFNSVSQVAPRKVLPIYNIQIGIKYKGIGEWEM